MIGCALLTGAFEMGGPFKSPHARASSQQPENHHAFTPYKAFVFSLGRPTRVCTGLWRNHNNPGNESRDSRRWRLHIHQRVHRYLHIQRECVNCLVIQRTIDNRTLD